MWEMVKVLAAVINRSGAKEMFKDGGEYQETVNENFESDLKAIDPGFEISSCKEIMDGLDK